MADDVISDDVVPVTRARTHFEGATKSASEKVVQARVVEGLEITPHFFFGPDQHCEMRFQRVLYTHTHTIYRCR